ncbi:MAG: DUF2842 domain-containing protein [Sphingomonadales bacterium]
MTPSPRRTFGMIVMVIGLVVYTAGVINIADRLVPFHWVVDLLFYLIAGIAWVVPAGLLLRWANGGPGPAKDPENDEF